tara:strand:+ start:2275 stop:3207 length:933 start_codon:yes stop_codon:yes gene_type:complete
MSNILIIKHGSLGDLIQANGAIKDIKNANPQSKVLLLTSFNYVNFMSSCPYIDGVLIDKRLPRWNIFYLIKLRRILRSYNFSKVFDLQNSSRTFFYRKYILTKPEWNSSLDALEPGQTKKDFDNEGVLERMEVQLKKGGVQTNYVKKIDLKWAIEDVSKLIKKYTSNQYIIVFPFCSRKHSNKKWPYFKELILKIRRHYNNRYAVLTLPGHGEINEAREINSQVVLIDNKPVDIKTMISLVDRAKFIISNDTGPAHICSHLNKNGLVLFGSHTTPTKVSIENKNFKAIVSENLDNLSVDDVIEQVKNKLN